MIATNVTADHVARGVLVCETVQELGAKINFKQLLELTGVISRDEVWIEHFPTTKVKLLGPLLAGIAQFGGYEVLSCVVDKNGERASRTYLRLHAAAMARQFEEVPALSA